MVTSTSAATKFEIYCPLKLAGQILRRNTECICFIRLTPSIAVCWVSPVYYIRYCTSSLAEHKRQRLNRQWLVLEVVANVSWCSTPKRSRAVQLHTAELGLELTFSSRARTYCAVFARTYSLLNTSFASFTPRIAALFARVSHRIRSACVPMVSSYKHTCLTFFQNNWWHSSRNRAERHQGLQQGGKNV